MKTRVFISRSCLGIQIQVPSYQNRYPKRLDITSSHRLTARLSSFSAPGGVPCIPESSVMYFKECFSFLFIAVGSLMVEDFQVIVFKWLLETEVRLFSFSKLQLRSSKAYFNSTNIYWSLTVMIKFYVSTWLSYGALLFGQILV